RRSAPFVTLDCTQVAKIRLESELLARFGLAEGGTLYVEHVGEMPLETQAQLLRVLATKRLARPGAREHAVDGRVVLSSPRELRSLVRERRFLDDLYVLLAGASVSLPPLRDRRRELPVLARRFLADACARASRPALAIAPAAMRVLA